MGFEYTAIPAPIRGTKAKTAKTPTDRYAMALTSELNRMAEDGWEYVRSDVLPSEERSGLTGRITVYHNLLIFRRAVMQETAQPTKARPATRPASVKSATKAKTASNQAAPAELQAPAKTEEK